MQKLAGWLDPREGKKMVKGKTVGKILLVPDFNGKTIQILLFSHTKWILSVLLLLIISFSALSIYQYNFYRKQLYSLMDEQSITSKSMNEMSMNGIQTKRELMRLTYEIKCLDKFIASANTFDKDATTKLSIPFSSMTFADYFRANSNKYDQAHPASSADSKVESKEDIARNLKESQARQASFRAYQDVTPSGYPVLGKATKPGNYIDGLGVAIICPIGSPIHATASGKIYQIKSVNKDCSIVEILHKNEKNNNVKTIYYYCYRPVIKIGQQVKKGQLIAYTGVYPTTDANIFCYQVNINKLLIQPK
jgi:hypothetical protein